MAVVVGPVVGKEGETQSRWGMTTFSSGWLMWGVLESFGGKVFNEDYSQCLINSPEAAPYG